MKYVLIVLLLCGAAFAQPPAAISTGLSGPNYQSAVNAWFTYLYARTPRAIVFPFDGGGSALTIGKTMYIRVPIACTITDWSISSTTAETVTIKVWKIATGTAIPTVSNSISTSGVSLSTGTHVRSTTLSDFTTTAIAANDVVAANITAVTSSQFVNFTLGCQP